MPIIQQSSVKEADLFRTPSETNIPLEQEGTYVHPSGDGNLHIPATGTDNNGKLLVAGLEPGDVSWKLILQSGTVVTEEQGFSEPYYFADCEVVFPVEFAGIPVITATPITGWCGVIIVDPPTTVGFTLRCFSTIDGFVAGINVNWIAVLQ